MGIRWLDDALADVTEIYRYIDTHDPRAATRAVERIRAAIEQEEGVREGGKAGTADDSVERLLERY